MTARAVVDATGIGGGLGGRLVPKSLVRAKSRLGLGAVFAPDLVELPPGELHMMVRPEGYTGLVSLEDGRICAAAAVDFDAVRERAPEAVFADFLRGAPRVRRARGDGDAWQDLRPLEGWRGTPALTRARPPGAVPGLYVVGDASGYVEPFTGEGIGWALAEGAAVVPYVAGALEGRAGTGAAAWAGAAEAYTPGATRTCRILARGLRSPKLVELALDVLQRAPAAGELLVQRTSRVPSVPRPPAA